MMAMTLLNNAATMMTLGELNKNNAKMNSATKKLASGMRLNGAMDGAANDTMTDEDRAISQKVMDKIIENVDDIATGTTFNGIHVLMPVGKSEQTDYMAADFVFVVDITGSMSSYISKTRDGLRGFADDVGAFSAALTVLASSVTGGGDGPESGLEAIMDPINGALAYEWRPDAKRHVVVITDAEYHDAADSSFTLTSSSGEVPYTDWYAAGDVVRALSPEEQVEHILTSGMQITKNP